MTDRKEAISIVVPTLNEADNIPVLFERLDRAMAKGGIPYEIIVIDDHSTDETVKQVQSLATRYNVRLMFKQGKPGKAHSLLQGFAAARHPLICMIDADLQYPPEAITPMHALLVEKEADIVISERVSNETSFLRQLSSKTFNFIFARLLFGITYDTQSGLKLFRKSILNDYELTPSPWSFDLEFLVRSLERKRTILSYNIPFAQRTAGVTKVKLLSTTFELAKASVKLRWNTSTKEVRAGHRVNTLFVRRAMQLSLAAMIVSTTLVLHVSAAHALSLPSDLLPSNPLDQVTSQVVDSTPLGSLDDMGDADEVITVPTDPLTDPADDMAQDVVGQLVDPGQVIGGLGGDDSSDIVDVPSQGIDVPAQGQIGQSMMQSPSSDGGTTTTGTTVSSTRATPPPSAASATTLQGTPGNSLQTTAPSHVFVDSTKLAAATAMRPFSSYASGYPVTKLDNMLSKLLSVIARNIVLAGALCIAAVIGVKLFGTNVAVAYQRIQQGRSSK